MLGVVVLLALALLGVAAWAVWYVGRTQRDRVRLRDALQGRGAVDALAATAPPVDDTHALVAVIVEPRDHPHLRPVLANVRAVLGPDVPVVCWHGPRTDPATLPAGTVAHALGVDSLDLVQYSYLLTRPWFWAALPGRHILVFQTDSCLLSQSRVRWQDFAAYDYVGAPWSGPDYWRHWPRGLPQPVGNGGLSLRRRQAMLDVTRAEPFLSWPYLVEDLYFAHALAQRGARLPSAVEAARLFYEMHESDVGPPWGCHKRVTVRWAAAVTPAERALVEGYPTRKFPGAGG